MKTITIEGSKFLCSHCHSKKAIWMIYDIGAMYSSFLCEDCLINKKSIEEHLFGESGFLYKHYKFFKIR